MTAVGRCQRCRTVGPLHTEPGPQTAASHHPTLCADCRQVARDRLHDRHAPEPTVATDGGPGVVEHLDVGQHGTERWFSRASTQDLEPEQAWTEARPVFCRGLDADEIRVHERARVLLLRKDSRLVSVIAIDGAKQSVVEDLRRQGVDV